jgi:hypothetical protein
MVKDYAVYLIKRQRKDIKTVGHYGKLHFKEILRIAKSCGIYYYGDDKCIPYALYVKSNVPDISFRGRKISLYRILYINFIGHIEMNESIETTCNTKYCVNICHLKKI